MPRSASTSSRLLENHPRSSPSRDPLRWRRRSACSQPTTSGRTRTSSTSPRIRDSPLPTQPRGVPSSNSLLHSRIGMTDPPWRVAPTTTSQSCSSCSMTSPGPRNHRVPCAPRAAAFWRTALGTSTSLSRVRASVPDTPSAGTPPARSAAPQCPVTRDRRPGARVDRDPGVGQRRRYRGMGSSLPRQREMSSVASRPKKFMKCAPAALRIRLARSLSFVRGACTATTVRPSRRAAS